jgi:hypothetical protein
MNAGSLEMRLNQSRPVVASTGGQAEVFEANGLAIRWTDAVPGNFWQRQRSVGTHSG